MINIKTITDTITNVLNKARPALQAIPPLIMVCSVLQRPGLSSMTIAANIIRRQSEAGAPVGALADGSQNVSEAMERIRIEEIIKALRLEAKVEVVVPPGSIAITAFGANAGGPVTVQGTNTFPVNLGGIVR